HVIGDQVSLEQMMEEVRAVMIGRMAALKPPVPYREFVARTRETPAAQHEAYFRELLGDLDEPTLPFDVADLRADHAPIEQAQRLLPQAVSRRIHAAAAARGVSAAVLFHVAWAVVLGRCSGRDDVVFGTVLLGRSQGFPGAERVMGLCMNTLPVRLAVGSMGAGEAVSRMFRQLAELLAHEQAPLALAQRCSAVAAPTPLFSALLNYRHSAADSVADDGTDVLDGFDGVRSLLGEGRTNYPVDVAIDDLGGDFRLVAQCAAG